MDENKRRLWTGIAIRIFALLYLLYILYKLSALHSAGEIVSKSWSACTWPRAVRRIVCSSPSFK